MSEMANWKEGDRVKIVVREVTEDDRKSSRYYSHMAGLSGTVQNVYGTDEIAVRIDIPALSKISASVHKGAVERMRERFISSVSEEQKKQLSSEELNFDAHYMLLCRSADLDRA